MPDEELARAVRTIEQMRREDRDFLTISTVRAATWCSRDTARAALVAVMGEDWMRTQEAAQDVA